MSLALSKTPKTGLFCVEAQIYYSRSLLLIHMDVLGNSKLVSG